MAELRSTMSSPEFAAWLAFDRVYPVGNRRLDILLATFAAMLASAVSGKEQKSEAFDILSDARFDEVDETVEDREAKAAARLAQSKAAVMGLTRSLGGTVQ